MELFEATFNRANIFNMLFFNVKAVLMYPTLEELELKDPKLFGVWKEIQTNKRFDYLLNDTYQTYAPNYPEFLKIVAITYGTVGIDNTNGTFVRKFNKICNLDEVNVIARFVDVLHEIYKIRQTTILCGHNIINYDVPLLLKRYLKLKNDLPGENKLVPSIIKKYLSSKPWDSMMIDTVNLWKFNGYGENASIQQIADYLDYKRTCDILSPSELSKYFWDNINVDIELTLNTIKAQSHNTVNLVVKLIDEISGI